MARAPIPDHVQNDVLTRSARRCALCFGLDGVASRVEGQIAHVDRDNGNPELENLAYLCLPHHNEYDSLPSQTKRLQPGELKHYRSQLHAAVAEGRHLVPARVETHSSTIAPCSRPETRSCQKSDYAT